MRIVNPEHIYSDFKTGKIDSSSAIEKLLVNLQKADDHTKKVQYIELFSEIYRDFKPENNEFDDKLIKLIKIAIQNENYIYVLFRFVDAVKQIEKSFEEIVTDEVIKKYVLFYDVIPEEAKFMVDLDHLDPTYGYTKKKIQFAERFKKKIAAYTKKDFFYNESYYYIKQSRIIGVRIGKKIEIIPESIQSLKKLNYLYLYAGKNKQYQFPKSMDKLTQLKNLRIESYDPIELPERIEEQARNYYSERYIQDGVCIEDALQLAKMDIIGWHMGNLEKDSLYGDDPEWYKMADADVWDYRIDKMGRVIEIYIKPHEGHWNLTYFPTALCFFKNLQILELKIVDLKIIPEDILNLKSLRSLTITNFGKNQIEISNSVKKFLESLEHFEI